MVRTIVFFALLLLAGCASDCGASSVADAALATTDGAIDGGQADRATGADLEQRDHRPTDLNSATDRTGNDAAGTDANGAADAAVVGLPFEYTRPATGVPVTPTELTAVTDLYLDLLTQTRYFDFLDERVHGWPESDPQQRYWYGVWWSGAGLEKNQGSVTFMHVDVGADNIGIPTSSVLEGVCLAHKVWPTARLEHLTRRLVRGFNSWILAMERLPDDPAGTLLARVGYPEPIASTDNGRSYFIDYSADRPGIDSYTLYVHLPTNPYWGDLYIKNKRSKDDIGHMLRAIATVSDCAPGFDVDTRADIDAMRANYASWCRQVEADNWSIATLDQDANVYIPPLDSTMSHFYSTGNAECNSMLAIRLLGQGDPGTFACDDGVNPLESLVLDNPSNGEILRSFHEAAVKHALLTRQNTIARDMLGGLVQRIDQGMGYAESEQWPTHMDAGQLAKLIVNGANAGVPLTSREVRFVHAQIEEAHTSYLANGTGGVYRVFEPATPDGAYDFTPAGSGLDFTFFAGLLGTCVATFRNPASVPLLDCARLQTFAP